MNPFKDYSQKDLEAASFQINSSKYPERYQECLDEIKARKVAGVWDKNPVSKPNKFLDIPDFKLRAWLPRYFYASSIFGTFLILKGVFNQAITGSGYFMLLIAILWNGTGFLTGFYLNKKAKISRIMGSIYLIPQIFSIAIGGFGFAALSGANLGLRFIKVGENANLGFQVDLLKFYIEANWYNATVPTFLSVNFLAIFLFNRILKLTNTTVSKV